MRYHLKLSIIIPFSKRLADADCLRRLDQAIGCFAQQPNIEVVVFDVGRRSALSALDHRHQPNLRYFHEYSSGVFSPGRVRNLAVNCARGEFIFLMDADLLISRAMVDRLLGYTEVLNSATPQAFYMFPCLYLSQAYSTDGQPSSFAYEALLESYLSGEIDKVDGIALASSCLLMRRQWFLAIGGFCESFAGHGYEDFELIHRLTHFYPMGKKPVDYWRDVKSHFPAAYQGFRRYFSVYAVLHLFKGEFLLHQWHPRPLTRLYHRKRKDNEARFAQVLKQREVLLSTPLNGVVVGAVQNDVELPDFAEWLTEQQRMSGYKIEDYPGLFHFKDGVNQKRREWWRKLRKLIVNPRGFFRDGVLGKRIH